MHVLCVNVCFWQVLHDVAMHQNNLPIIRCTAKKNCWDNLFEKLLDAGEAHNANGKNDPSHTCCPWKAKLEMSGQ